MTIESPLEVRLRDLAAKVGSRLAALFARTDGVLVTTAKDNLVDAINEVALTAGAGGGGGVTLPISLADTTDTVARSAVTTAERTKLAGIEAGATLNSADATLLARSNHTGTQSLDTTIDSGTRVAFTPAERTKLTGVATGATANDTDANLKSRANHTGTQSMDTVVDSATRLAFLPAERTKLTGVATNATANDTDANLKARANHTGTQAPSTISFASTARFLGRTTAGAGAGEELTAAQAKALLAIAAGDISGLGYFATGTLASNLTGTLAAAQLPAHTGEVTSSAGSAALTIVNGAVTLAKQANMATASVVYRKTAGAGAPEVQSLATLKADLGLTGTNSGDETKTSIDTKIGVDGATTTQFYSKAGTWLAPAGGGGGTTTNALTFATTGGAAAGSAFNGSAAVTVDFSTVGAAKTGAITGSGLTMTSARALARTTAGAGAVEELTSAQFKAFLSITAADVSGLSSFATGTDAANLTGTVAAARIADGSLALAKLANIANATIVGNNSGAAGAPLALTAAQAKAVLAISAADVSGLAATATSTAASNLTGTLNAAQLPAFSGGDVTSAAGSANLSIGANRVSNAMLSQVGTATIKGRVTASTGNVEDLTGAQATSLLDVFTSGAKGLAPASGGGTTNFLRADGSWTAPPSGGSITNYSNALAADVQMATTNTWYQGASITLPAGTFLVVGFVTIQRNAAVAAQYEARMNSNAATYASTQCYQPANSGHTVSMTVAAIVTLASGDNVVIAALSSVGATTCLLKAAAPQAGVGNNATQMVAIRLA